MMKMIYDKPFCQNDTEARAVIVEGSDPKQIKFCIGITERFRGSKEMMTFGETIQEECAGIPDAARERLWEDLFRQARETLEREIRVATDPLFDLPDREVY